MYAKLSKVVITIASADYFEQIECLGAHALLGFQENQTLACKGVQVKTYKGNRCCATTLLSYLHLNTAESVGVVAPPSSLESPRKKATLTKVSQQLTTMTVTDWAESMLQDSLRTMPAILPSGVCTLRGRLCPLTMENFPSAPTYERNGQQQVRFQADCVDGKGTLKYVTV